MFKALKLFLIILISFSSTDFAQVIVSTVAANFSPTGVEGLALDHNGFLYTPTGPGSRVYKVNSANGEAHVVLTGLNFPQGGGVDPAGNYYAANYNTGAITKLTPDSSIYIFADDIFGIAGVTYRPQNNSIIIANYAHNSIYEASLADSVMTVYFSGGGLNGPDGLAFDSDDNLYVANFNDNKIHKITPNKEISLFAQIEGLRSGYIAIHGNTMYVAGLSVNKIFTIDLVTREISVLAGTGVSGYVDGSADSARFNKPNGIVVDPSGDRVYVADAGNNAIRVISGIISGVEENDDNIPVDFNLDQNYPNPFNPNTKIRYSIGEQQFVSLKVFDVLGNEVEALVNEEKPAGEYDVEFNIKGLINQTLTISSGVYFYQLNAGSFVQTKKMLLLK